MAKQIYLDPVSGEPQTPAPQETPPEVTPTPTAPAPGPLPTPTVPPGNISTQPVPTPDIPAPGKLVNPGPGPVTAPLAGTDPGRAGNLNDPAYRDALIAYWGSQPGANPSVKNDPNYWRTVAPKFNGDVNEYIRRMMLAEGAPEGGGAPPPPPPGGNGTDPNISDFFKTQADAIRAQQARDAEIRKIIMERLALAGQPVDENSAEVTQPLSAARNEAQRSQDAERTALAERLYAQGGLNTDALGRQIQQSSERNAGSLGNLRAGLITHIADAKRQELESLLQMATAQGDAASARAISAEIAAINASVTSQGQGISLAEFLASLNQNTALAGLNG